MDSYDKLPDAEITNTGPFSEKFLSLGIKTYKEACMYIHNLKYGYNSNYEDRMILFKEQMGSCTMKHATAAALAQELGIPIHKNIMVYKFTEDITTGAGEINRKYNIPYTPLTHCFLTYKDMKFDLTEGNKNGKKKHLDEYIAYEQVEPFISHNDEYKLFKRILKETILPSEEMKGVKEISLLKAREESIKLLKESVK